MTGRAVALVGVLITLAQVDTRAGQADSWFEKATEFYRAENYDSAASYFLKIDEAGVHNADVYYNLGNCHFRRNRLGLAVLYYEKARRIVANDPDVVHNLRFARLNMVDRVPQPQRTFFESVLSYFHTWLPLGTQLWVITALFVALGVLVSCAFFVSRNVRLWLVYLSCLILFGLLTVSVSAGTKIYHLENVSYAVVLAKSADALNAPEGDKVLFTAHEGTTFRVRKRVDAWMLVSLPNGVSGWVESNSLGSI